MGAYAESNGSDRRPQGHHLQMYVSFSRHSNAHLAVFVFTRRALLLDGRPEYTDVAKLF